MFTIINILKIIIGLGLLNVWIIRFNKTSSYRGGDAKNMIEEFEHAKSSAAEFDENKIKRVLRECNLTDFRSSFQFSRGKLSHLDAWFSRDE